MMLVCRILILISMICMWSGSYVSAQMLRAPSKPEPVVIDEITVRGNDRLDDKKIKSQLTLSQNHWYNVIKKKKLLTERVLQYQEALIDSLYHVNGFLDGGSRIAVKPRGDSKRVEVIIEINEGLQTLIGKVQFSGELQGLDSKVMGRLKKIKAGKPYNHMQIAEAAYELKDLFAANGYAYCEIKSSAQISTDRRTADVMIKIISGPKTSFGNIAISGLNNTKENVVKRELLFHEGDSFNKEKILDSQRRLYSSGLFSYVSANPQYFTDTHSPPDIEIRLTERKSNYLNVRGGAGQDHQRDFTLDTSAEYGNRNLFGTGRRASAKVVSSFAISTRQDQFKNFKNSFALTYLEPWTFFVRMPLEIQLTYEPKTQSATQSYSYDKYAASFTLTRELDRYTDLRFTEDFESINIHDIPAEQQASFRESDKIKLRRKFISSIRKDRRDNLLIPTSGYLTQLAFEYVGGIQGGDVDFLKFGIDWNRYQVFRSKNVFASRLQLNWLKEFGSRRIIPIEDLLFLGGANSVRGYKENDLGPKFTVTDADTSLWGTPKGGKFSLLANFEIRRPLFWRFGVTAFVDVGNLWNSPEEFQVKDLRLTAGTGIQFFTPIGPIRFDYALRVIRAGDKPGSKYHFSILYIF